MSVEEQTEKLASFICEEIKGESSQSEGASECAIRIIRDLKKKWADARYLYKNQRHLRKKDSQRHVARVAELNQELTKLREEIRLLKGGKPKVRDLGWANGWKATPEVVSKCLEAGHKRDDWEMGRCDHEIRCDICGYRYRMDSSG